MVKRSAKDEKTDKMAVLRHKEAQIIKKECTNIKNLAFL